MMRGSRFGGKQKKEQKKEIQKKDQRNARLTNDQYLINTLKLLGVSQNDYFKFTKSLLEGDIFTNTVNPANSKQFFFISFTCLKNLSTEDEIKNLEMWYPPRTLNEQQEYKKQIFKLIQQLQISGRLPKNILLSKAMIMGDTNASSIVQFLRFLSEMSLRNQYLEKFSKKDRLIQIGFLHTKKQRPNDINNFYSYPFVPTKSAIEHPNKVDLSQLKQTYQSYLKIYKNKLVNMKTNLHSSNLNKQHKKMMSGLMEQKQLIKVLKEKIPPTILTQNRAFDRRRLIEKNSQIWKELFQVECYHGEKGNFPALNIEGEVDKIMKNWEEIKNTGKLKSVLENSDSVNKHKEELHLALKKYYEIKKLIMSKLS